MGFYSTCVICFSSLNYGLPGLEIRVYGRRDLSRWPLGALYPPKLEVISPTGGGRSVGIIRSRIQATELTFFLICGLNFEVL
jgi:hypothetical protein